MKDRFVLTELQMMTPSCNDQRVQTHDSNSTLRRKNGRSHKRVKHDGKRVQWGFKKEDDDRGGRHISNKRGDRKNSNKRGGRRNINNMWKRKNSGDRRERRNSNERWGRALSNRTPKPSKSLNYLI